MIRRHGLPLGPRSVAGAVVVLGALCGAQAVIAQRSDRCPPGHEWSRRVVACVQSNCGDVPDAHLSYTGGCVCGSSGAVNEDPNDPNKECTRPSDHPSCPGCTFACVHADEPCPGEAPPTPPSRSGSRTPPSRSGSPAEPETTGRPEPVTTGRPEPVTTGPAEPGEPPAEPDVDWGLADTWDVGGSAQPDEAATACDRYPPPERQGVAALMERALGESLGRVGASVGWESAIPPGVPCFAEHLDVRISASAHGLDGNLCSSSASASGSVETCTEAFCLKDCIRTTVSGGYSTEYERVCEDPPYWTCDYERYCTKKSGTFSVERSGSFSPDVEIRLGSLRAECGLELTLSGGVSGSLTHFDGPTCQCPGGGTAATVRAFTTFGGNAECKLELKLFGVAVGLPPFGAQGCLNAGLRTDGSGCRRGEQAGRRVVGGATFKLQVPPISVGWFKVDGTVRTVHVPEGRETGCSGATDL